MMDITVRPGTPKDEQGCSGGMPGVVQPSVSRTGSFEQGFPLAVVAVGAHGLAPSTEMKRAWAGNHVHEEWSTACFLSKSF